MLHLYGVSLDLYFDHNHIDIFKKWVSSCQYFLQLLYCPLFFQWTSPLKAISCKLAICLKSLFFILVIYNHNIELYCTYLEDFEYSMRLTFMLPVRIYGEFSRTKSIHFIRNPHADFTTVSGHSNSFTNRKLLGLGFLKALFESDFCELCFIHRYTINNRHISFMWTKLDFTYSCLEA